MSNLHRNVFVVFATLGLAMASAVYKPVVVGNVLLALIAGSTLVGLGTVGTTNTRDYSKYSWTPVKGRVQSEYDAKPSPMPWGISPDGMTAYQNVTYIAV